MIVRMGYGYPEKYATTFDTGNERAKGEQYAVVRFRGRNSVRVERQKTRRRLRNLKLLSQLEERGKRNANTAVYEGR